MFRRIKSANSFIDGMCPIDWTNPLNRNLVNLWNGALIPGWFGGTNCRDFVIGRRLATNLILEGGMTWLGKKMSSTKGGTQLAVSPSTFAPNIGSNATMYWWGFMSVAPNDYTHPIGHRVGSRAGTAYAISINTSKASFEWAGSYGFSGGPSITLNADLFLAISVSGTNIICYAGANGNLQSVATTTNSGSPSAGYTAIGGDTYENSRTLGGYSYEAGYYNAALTGNQLDALYIDLRNPLSERFRWVSTRNWSFPSNSNGFRSRLGNGLIKKSNTIGVGSAIV